MKLRPLILTFSLFVSLLNTGVAQDSLCLEIKNVIQIYKGHGVCECNGKYGLARKPVDLVYKYDTIIPIDYDPIVIALVKVDNKWGLIDINDSILIPIKYQYLVEDWYGYHWEAPVKYAFFGYLDGKAGTVDAKGKTIVPFIYDDLSGWCEYAPPAYFSEKQGLYGLVNASGDELLENIYEGISYSRNSYLLKKDGKFGLLHGNFDELLPIKYDIILYDYYPLFATDDEAKGDVIIAKRNNKWFIYTWTGELIDKNVEYSFLQKNYPDLLEAENNFDLIGAPCLYKNYILSQPEN